LDILAKDIFYWKTGQKYREKKMYRYFFSSAGMLVMKDAVKQVRI